MAVSYKKLWKLLIDKDLKKKDLEEMAHISHYKTFMDNALRDPITGEIGKGIIFCVSRKHAAKRFSNIILRSSKRMEL